MSLTWPAKDPSEVLDYEVDMTSRLAGDQISTAVFTFTTQAGLVINSQSNTASTATLWLSSGTDGLTGEILLTVVTAGGRTLEETIFLPIISSAVIDDGPTTTTKRQLVEMAFEEITLAGYEFDTQPEEQSSALRRLDALMAQWKVSGLDVGYIFPASIGGGDLEDASGVPDFAVNCIVTELAERLMPAIGKSKTPATQVAQAKAMTALRTALAVIPDAALPVGTVRGAGNKPGSTWRPFQSQPL